MKIAVAQTRPVRGDIKTNIENHRNLISVALTRDADAIIFPELSLTGYEPRLASELATSKEDRRLDVFQEISDAHEIMIAVGLPTNAEPRPCISMVIFQAGLERQIYSKQYLHVDEDPFFISGKNSPLISMNGLSIAPAICYELSVREHAANAHKNGADIYVASVAKTQEGVERSREILAQIANKYSMIVLMSNCVGPCDNFQSAGQTAIWNSKGELLKQLDNQAEGVLIIDTSSEVVIAETL